MRSGSALKKNRLRAWFVEGMLLALVVIAVYAFTQWRGDATTVPQQFPALMLQNTQGRWLHYQPTPGQITLVNFWSPDCPPCIAEIPALNTLQNWLGSKKFTVLGIAVAGNAPQAVAQARAHWNISYPLYVDGDGGASRLLGGVTLTPTSLLINGQGHIVGRYVGAISLPVVVGRLLWMSL